MFSGRDLKTDQHQHARQRLTRSHSTSYIYLSQKLIQAATDGNTSRFIILIDKLSVFNQNAPQAEQRQLYIIISIDFIQVITPRHQLYILAFLIHRPHATRSDHTRTQQYYLLSDILCSVYATTDHHRSTGTIIYNSISDTTENATSKGRESAHGLYYNLSGYTSKPCIIHCRRIYKEPEYILILLCVFVPES